jgi:hypothetical protein
MNHAMVLMAGILIGLVCSHDQQIHANQFSLRKKNFFMSVIRNELIYTVAYKSVDYNIYNDIHKKYEFKKQIIFNNDTLDDDEAIRILNKSYDRHKILYNSGFAKIVLAISYFEFCVRNYLRANFSN